MALTQQERNKVAKRCNEIAEEARLAAQDIRTHENPLAAAGQHMIAIQEMTAAILQELIAELID